MAEELTDEQLWFAAVEVVLARAFINVIMFVCELRAYIHIGRDRKEALRKAERAADGDKEYWKNDEKWKAELLSQLKLWSYYDQGHLMDSS